MTTSTRNAVQESYVDVFGAVFVGAAIGGVAWLMRYVPAWFGATPLVLPLWVLAAPLAAALLVWLLVKLLRYPPGGGALLFGLPFLALALASGVPAFLPAPSAPAGTPAELSRLPFTSHLPVGTDAVVLFREDDGTTTVDVDFPDVESINGYWAFSSGTVKGPGLSARAESREADWGDTITSSGDGDSTITPTMQLELTLTPQMDGTTIPATAEMMLRYPQGGYWFTDDPERVQRDLQLFVAGPGLREFGERMTAWRQAQAVTDDYVVGLAIIGGIGLLATGGGLLSLLRAGGRGPSADVLGTTGLVVAEAVAVPAGRVGPDGPTTMVQLAAPQPGSPAERAGVRAGDVLLAADGKLVEGVEPLRKQVRGWQPGTGHRLDLMRDRQPATATLTL